MLRLITAAAVLAMATPAIADQPSYNFIVAGYQTVEFDNPFGGDVDGDGFAIGGSYAVAENWHIIGGYTSLGFDFGIDLNELVIGGGYHTAISDTTSAFAELAYVNAEVDAGGAGNVDDSGFGFSVGLRSNVTERVELSGFLSYVDFGDGGDATSVGGGAWYLVNDTIEIGVTAEFDEDVTGFGIGGRFFF